VKKWLELLEVVFRRLGYYGIGTTHTFSSSQRWYKGDRSATRNGWNCWRLFLGVRGTTVSEQHIFLHLYPYERNHRDVFYPKKEEQSIALSFFFILVINLCYIIHLLNSEYPKKFLVFFSFLLFFY